MSGRHRHRKPFRVRVTAGFVRLAQSGGLVTNPTAPDPAHQPPPLMFSAAPATLPDPVVPESVADIDPAQQPPELPARTTAAARASVAAVHADHPTLPAGLVRWTYHDDGATGVVSQNLDVSDERRRAIVFAYAAALASQPDTRERDDGYEICSTAGQHPNFPGLKLAVEATCCPAVEERLAVYEAAVEGLRPDEDAVPAGDAPTAPAPAPARLSLPPARPRLALPAPRRAT
jgi:hypothetical protein